MHTEPLLFLSERHNKGQHLSVKDKGLLWFLSTFSLLIGMSFACLCLPLFLLSRCIPFFPISPSFSSFSCENLQLLFFALGLLGGEIDCYGQNQRLNSGQVLIVLNCRPYSMQSVLYCMKLLRDERLELSGMPRSELDSRMYCLARLNMNAWVEHYYIWTSSTSKKTAEKYVIIWMRLIALLVLTASLLICQICGCHYRCMASPILPSLYSFLSIFYIFSHSLNFFFFFF